MTYCILHVNEQGNRYSGIPSALAHHIREEIPHPYRFYFLEKLDFCKIEFNKFHPCVSIARVFTGFRPMFVGSINDDGVP